MILQTFLPKNTPHISCCPPVLVQSDLLKYLYAGMLIQLPQEKIREFWNKCPPPVLPFGFEEADLFNFLWTGGHPLPLEYVAHVLNGLEQMLDACGVSDIDFVATLSREVSRGSVVPASMMLSWMKPFLKLFFVNTDIRLMLLRIFNHLASKILKDITFRISFHDSNEKRNTTTLMVMHSSVVKRRRSLKRAFAGRLPAVNGELWISKLVQMMPIRFDLPSFEEGFILADSRGLQDILSGRLVVNKNGKIYINETLYGITIDFHAFCKKNSIDLTTFDVPDCQIIMWIKDYFCPKKKRVILHKGCAYGSPVILFGFNYKKNIPVPPGFLSSFLDEAVSSPGSSWKEAEQRHKQLLETVSFKAKFVYHVADGSISLNGEHFVKNVPAKILRKMLLAHTVSGQTVFSHREFATDSSIASDPKAPNIIIRIRRLSRAIEERLPKIKITRVSRGKIALVPSCKIEFSEK
ncbi:MAG TPA: hypothetical protein VLX68_01505 [Chitinivibrionales bacterium]|nr:hypothetical protein [Chitinivibrionales bacterium]